MPQLGQRSKDRLLQVHPDMVRVVERAIVLVPPDHDFTVICGHRNEADQNKAFKEKRTQLRWPKSKHNQLPSRAVDLAPYPIDWNDEKRFIWLATYMYRAAAHENVWIRWGGHWTFKDMPHFELMGED